MEDRRNASEGRLAVQQQPFGFTLVELLVIIGIIALLIALLTPTFSAARNQANSLRCASNVRQICLAMFEYAALSKGNLPPNVLAPQPQQWYDPERIGALMKSGGSEVRGPAVSCPEDAGAQRSYSMNGWASSRATLTSAQSGTGRLWKLGVRNASRMILITEKWSSTGSETSGWTAEPTVGQLANPPGRRFGGGGGLTQLFWAGRFSYVNSELPYERHRKRSGAGSGTQPIGRLNIGYADGHVALKSEYELAGSITGLSTLDSWWSPIDDQLNQ